MKSTPHATVLCQVRKKEVRAGEAMPAGMVHGHLLDLIQKAVPDWSPDGHICLVDLNRFRALYVQQVLQEEKGELTTLDEEVVRSIREHEVMAVDVNAEFDRKLTFGQRLADHIAEFGGSWAFIMLFGGVILVWISYNTVHLLQKPFDPFPYILLNLVLSCLAAIQAPVIMMSQNRQEAKDRLHADHDYRVNLKAELEIRQLHAKVDQLLQHQWQRLLEIQQIQTEMMQEIVERTGGRKSA